MPPQKPIKTLGGAAFSVHFGKEYLEQPGSKDQQYGRGLGLTKTLLSIHTVDKRMMENDS